TIRLDGTIIGVSPMGAFDAAGGTHTITVEKEGFIRASKDVLVASSEETTVAISLLPSAEYIRAYEDGAGLVRTLAWSSTIVGALAAGGAVGAYVLGGQKADAYRARVDAHNASPQRSSEELAALDKLSREVGTFDFITVASAG